MSRLQNITPEAFRPRAPRDETVRIRSFEPRQRPPNFAARIQSLSFDRSRWHPVASLRSGHPLNLAPGGATVRVENPLRRLRWGLFHGVSQVGRWNLTTSHFLQTPVVCVQQSSHERAAGDMIWRSIGCGGSAA